MKAKIFLDSFTFNVDIESISQYSISFTLPDEMEKTAVYQELIKKDASIRTLYRGNHYVCISKSKIEFKLIDELREQIKQNYNMGFITYNEYLWQMVEFMESDDLEFITSRIQEIEDSKEMNDARDEASRMLQNKLDELLSTDDSINSILKNYE